MLHCTSCCVVEIWENRVNELGSPRRKEAKPKPEDGLPLKAVTLELKLYFPARCWSLGRRLFCRRRMSAPPFKVWFLMILVQFVTPWNSRSCSLSGQLH